ncbi:MAG: glycosyltransferase family 2 protein [Clostridiales bacterium]|nr:glycosyltransferase family 2 protein [Clostridiales bacterium]
MNLKLISFAVPCYNSAAYMSHCIETLLSAGEEAEIILVDDGSTDETGAIADAYAEKYPSIVRVIHQPNGGHGEGVNQGVRNATGVYYKVVDSDDWLDMQALKQVMAKLREFAAQPKPVDMVIANYVYEHAEDGTHHTVDYHRVFPEDKVFTWDEVGHWGVSQYLLMHSVIYRTQLLRDCGLELPKHTFYVDNIFVYQPLPSVYTMYYMNLDLYRYFIGRADQSVNEAVMVKRIDQQLLVTRLMIDCCDLTELRQRRKKVASYMVRYLTMMMCICSMFLIIDGSDEALQKRSDIWAYLKQADQRLYDKIRHRSLATITMLPTYQGRKLTVRVYHLVQKVYKFN